MCASWIGREPAIGAAYGPPPGNSCDDLARFDQAAAPAGCVARGRIRVGRHVQRHRPAAAVDFAQLQVDLVAAPTEREAVPRVPHQHPGRRLPAPEGLVGSPMKAISPPTAGSWRTPDGNRSIRREESTSRPIRASGGSESLPSHEPVRNRGESRCRSSVPGTGFGHLAPCAPVRRESRVEWPPLPAIDSSGRCPSSDPPAGTDSFSTIRPGRSRRWCRRIPGRPPVRIPTRQRHRPAPCQRQGPAVRCRRTPRNSRRPVSHPVPEPVGRFEGATRPGARSAGCSTHDRTVVAGGRRSCWPRSGPRRPPGWGRCCWSRLGRHRPNRLRARRSRRRSGRRHRRRPCRHRRSRRPRRPLRPFPRRSSRRPVHPPSLRSPRRARPWCRRSCPATPASAGRPRRSDRRWTGRRRLGERPARRAVVSRRRPARRTR